MNYYKSRYTGAQIDSLLDKVKEDLVEPATLTNKVEANAAAIGKETEDREKAVSGLNSALTAELDKKVSKVPGKGLSTNDYTDDDKAEVTKIKDKADQTDLNETNNNIEGINTAIEKETEDREKAISDLNSALTTELNNKVSKVPGKGLSTNDYTDSDKAEVAKVKDKVDQTALDETNRNIKGINTAIEKLVPKEDINTSTFDPTSDNPASQKSIAGEMEKKQDKLTAGDGITIENGVISVQNGVISASLLISITYSDLVALRDSSSLVPGAQYRITDYACTTATSNTSSAGHQFDIIVEADSASTLNENAKAAIHDGDTYFANSDLEAWELKYCIDNDTDRFAWADTTNGKGVIYWMKDEFNNECPYDFKNVLYSVNGSINIAEGGLFIRYPEADKENHYMWKSTVYDDILVYTDTETPTTSSNAYYDEGDGNIQTLSITDVHKSITNSYTFAYTDNSVLYDASINGLDKSCYNNIMKEYHSSNKLQLNWNIFYTTSTTFSCYSNSFDRDCHDNTFDNSCYQNIFGNNCYGNIFGFSSCGNTFDNGCYQNTAGGLFLNNTFGKGCYNNNFSGGCYNNTFGDNCYSNTVGGDFRDNTFGDNCYNNILGEHCYDNTFGNNCYRIIFGTSEGTINYCGYNIFDSNCSDINLCSEDANENSSNYLQNVHVRLGVKGTEDTPLILTVPDRNLPYETDFYLDESGNLKVSRFDIPQTLTAGAGISIENGVISVSYANADEEAF